MSNDYKNLKEWCDEYSKKTGVKIFPQTAPLQLVMEDLVGNVRSLNEKVESLRRKVLEMYPERTNENAPEEKPKKARSK